MKRHTLPLRVLAGIRRTARRDQGNTAIDAAILIPAIFLIGMLMIMGGRTVQARGVVAAAAHEAARAASIARTTDAADASARSTVDTVLKDSDIVCLSHDVRTDLTAFNLPIGDSGPVTVTVQCEVPLSDLSLPGVPGSLTVTVTGQSAIDAHRGRESQSLDHNKTTIQT